MPNPAWSILGNRRKMKVVRRPLMLHIKGCEASCPCMLHLFLDMCGRVRESHVNCGWWCHLPWACSCMPVCVLFYKHLICLSGVVSNTGVWACVVCVDHVCSCPGVLAGTWGKFGSYFPMFVCRLRDLGFWDISGFLCDTGWDWRDCSTRVQLLHYNSTVYLLI